MGFAHEPAGSRRSQRDLLFATMIALVIIPCLYLALEDVKRLFGLESEKVVLDPAPVIK